MWTVAENISVFTVFAARCYASAAYTVMRCLCRLSVMFVHSVKTNKHLQKFFHHRVAIAF